MCCPEHVNERQRRTVKDSAEYAGQCRYGEQCRTVLESAEYGGQCRTVQYMEDNAGQRRMWRTVEDSAGQCRI
jgi:hypothetical protein